MNNKIELLAPAGSTEAAQAAIEYGADAIYLGLPYFSARAEAINFTEDEFYNIVGYAHSLNKKVYVTLNTLIKESEIDNLLNMMDLIEKSGADAAIVQDLGVLRLLNNNFPNVQLHASTQMAIHNRLGAEYLLNLGIKRVTLARELSIKEISEIATIENLETESFIHGALCYSYSGLCMYSSMQTGRSANRGRCAYSCREVFSCPELDLKGHAFSLRDLSLTDNIESLLDSGVDSLKIEGRKKNAQYVAAVVRLYRGIIDKRDSKSEIQQHITDLKTIFSRESTNFFANGEAAKEGRSHGIDTEAVGHRGAIIGQVEAITTHGKDKRINFTTLEDFEKHDGIQVDIPDEERPYGFPVNDLFRVMPDGRAKSTFIVEKGNKASIVLPPDHPTLPIGAPVYLASSQRVKRELKWHSPKPGEHRLRYPVNIALTLSSNSIIITSKIKNSRFANNEIILKKEYTNDENFSKAKNPEQTRTAAEKVFNKTGQTLFTLDKLTIEDEEKLFIPMSLLNNLRRELYEELTALLENEFAQHLSTIKDSIKKQTSNLQHDSYFPEWVIKTDNPISLFHIDPELTFRICQVIVEINENTNSKLLLDELDRITNTFNNSTIRLALPSVCRNSRLNNIKTVVQDCIDAGLVTWQANNLWGVQLLKERNITDISGAASIYSLNHASIDEQLSMGLGWSTLSVEDALNNIKDLIKLRGKNLCLTVYQDTPLFIGEACSYSSFSGGCKEDCTEINNHRKWIDMKGNSYLLNKKGCRTFLINENAFSLSGHLDKLDEIKPKYFEADFINKNYDSENINKILRQLFSDMVISNTHTGNFLRTLQ